jgi:hypothetical protein
LSSIQKHLCKLSDSWDKSWVFSAFLSPLGPEVNQRSAAAARKTRPIVIPVLHGETGVLVLMEGAMASTPAINVNILAHKLSQDCTSFANNITTYLFGKYIANAKVPKN